jgi:hypothetical protein
LQEDPEFSEEALTAKRMSLKRTFPDLVIEESDVRTPIEPALNAPVASAVPLGGSRKRSREALDVGKVNGGEASSSAEHEGPTPKRARKTTAYVYLLSFLFLLFCLFAHGLR